MRGRKPKPTVLKVLAGNPGKHPLPVDEPIPTGKAIKPAWLSDHPKASTVWDEIAPIVEAMGLLTDADEKTFARYCYLYSEFKSAPEKFAMAQHARLDNLEARFGLDPSSRARIGLKPRKQKENAFAKLG